MTTVVTIGEFARLTHLSVKALRHYHDVGLLEPSDVDPTTGYRRYAVDQVGTAQLIRRLRELEMPIPSVLAVVSATDEPSRDAAIRDHLERMERELDRTRAVVGSLRELLAPGP
ncbi:MAG: helix-turn-helix domain-containing protein, partial [Propionibacteriaceae bacterium]